MKMRNLQIAAFVGLFLAANTIAVAEFQEETVSFIVIQGKGELNAQSGNQNCTRGKGVRKGCVKFFLNDIARITFKLVGNPTVRMCSDNNTKYVITEVELSHEGYLVPDNAGPKLADKGIFDQAVPQWLKDAFPGTGADGVVYTASKDDATTKVSIINLNNQDNSSGTNEKNIWYRVSVTNCETGTVLQSDPRFENEGTN